MPFTASHILAIIPFSRYSRLPLSALAIGSMAPDVTLFYPVGDYHQAHSLIGIITFGWFWGLLLTVYFEQIGKHFFIGVLPLWVQARMEPYRQRSLSFNGSTFFYLSISVILGATTHVVWDSFTHDYGWFVENITLLQNELTIGPITKPAYRWLQYISSAFGLLALIAIAWWALNRQIAYVVEPLLSRKSRVMVFVGFCLLPLLVIIAYAVSGDCVSRISHWVIDSLSVIISTYFVVSAAYWVRYRRVLRSKPPLSKQDA